MATPILTAEDMLAHMEEATPGVIEKYLYPYPGDDVGLNWAWMATALGAVTAVAILEGVKVKVTHKSIQHPVAPLVAVAIGAWVGPKIIKPA